MAEEALGNLPTNVSAFARLLLRTRKGKWCGGRKV